MGKQESIRPCESVNYVHFLIGGPADGDRIPSQHQFDSVQSYGAIYKRDGEAERMDEGPAGLSVLNCTDDYVEPVFFRVNMKYHPEHPQ